jgi:hypothetical protein
MTIAMGALVLRKALGKAPPRQIVGVPVNVASPVPRQSSNE